MAKTGFREVVSYIGIGSNQGDSWAVVRRAVGMLGDIEGISRLRVSPWYASKAVGPGRQRDYLNGVLEASCTLSAPQLLAELQRIESACGRARTRRWAPRTLDLDLLLHGDQTIDTPTLKVPHPFLMQRNFVVFPLYDLAPELVLPDSVTVSDLRRALSSEGLRRFDVVAAEHA